MTIGAVGARVTATAASPARSDPDARRAAGPTPLVAEDAQAANDPLRPPGADGWAPDRIVAVRSRNEGGFAGSATRFALGGVDERPGQRLSTAQVDRLAPFYATQFGLDEGFVRAELAKVYLYVGGPSTTAGQAMTIGHHVFMPDEQSLEKILSLPGRRWLAHELAHTMQFLAYQDSSPHSFLAEYFSSVAVGRNPDRPGTGDGPYIWGAAFTGLRDAGRTEDEIGTPATGILDRATSSVLPGTLIGLPLGLTAGGAIAAGRATSGHHLLGGGSAMRTGMGVVGAPVIAGSLIGAWGDKIGTNWSTVLGGGAGGVLAGTALLRSGAFSAGGSRTATGLGHNFGRGAAIAAAVGLTVAGAALGAISAAASANTVKGGTDNAALLAAIHKRERDNNPKAKPAETLSFQGALHDTHWVELDAEALAQQFVRGEWERPTDGAPVTGRTPTAARKISDRIDRDLSDRADWAIKLPLLLGVPATLAVGAGVLGGRTGATLIRSTVRDGRSPREAIAESMRMLGSQQRGVLNSLGVGASLTVAPLMAGGAIGPLVYNVTGSTTASRLGGAGAGAIATGVLLTLLLKGKGASLIATSTRVFAGMAVGGALGLAAGGVATDALRPQPRSYDVRGGTSAK